MNVHIELRSIIDRATPFLSAITDEEAIQAQADSSNWSRKEILGHLIDSAANNHQRFVRAQLAEGEKLNFPSYAGSSWVSIQHYNSGSWTDMIELWKSYNFHLTQIIQHIKPSALECQCTIGDDQPVTLEFLITDYVRHLLHHLRQILGKDFQ